MKLLPAYSKLKYKLILIIGKWNKNWQIFTRKHEISERTGLHRRRYQKNENPGLLPSKIQKK